MTTLPKVDTNCTAPSLIPTVIGNTVRSFSTHGHQSAAKGSSTTVSRSAIRLIQPFDFSALWSDGPEVALNWLFSYPIFFPRPVANQSGQENGPCTMDKNPELSRRACSSRHARYNPAEGNRRASRDSGVSSSVTPNQSLHGGALRACMEMKPVHAPQIRRHSGVRCSRLAARRWT
jgi:hypothetical protein